MGRTFAHSVDLPDGARVGFGLTRRGRVYGVRFRDASGEWVERSTEEVQKGRAVDRARELIAEFFRSAEGPGAGWEEVAGAVDGLAYLRPETRRAYRSALDLLRTALPELSGPAAVDAEAASRFLRVYSAGTWRAGPNAAARPRTANTVRSTIRTLRALWSKHLRELGVVTRNPWADLTPPSGERRAPVSPDEDRVSEFLNWVRAEFPGGVLHTFFTLKAYCGCRLADICQLRDEQVRDGGGHFTAEQTKNIGGRFVPLPAELFDRVKGLTGTGWVWAAAESEKVRNRAGAAGGFKWRTLYWRVEDCFDRFNRGTPDKPPLSSHDLRRRALTVLSELVGVDAAAEAVGVSPQTARRHYVDRRRAMDAAKTFREHGARLLPKGS